jgi:uncharacterized protein YdeI (BOF family)
MKTQYRVLVAASLTALVTTSALAAISTIKDMKNGSQVSISGTVENVKNEREFTLRDKSGTIDVDIDSNQSVVLKAGDTVSVLGVIDSGITGTDINAREVTVKKDLVKAITDSIEGNSTASLEGATSYNIKNLPKEGLVKVSGTVTDVDNEKAFTLKDDTGSVDVHVKSAEKAALTTGAQVTVIGYVDNGMFSKDINARKVLVVADAHPNN